MSKIEISTTQSRASTALSFFAMTVTARLPVELLTFLDYCGVAEIYRRFVWNHLPNRLSGPQEDAATKQYAPGRDQSGH